MQIYRTDDGPREILSYLTLRRTVGILGCLLPVILALGCVALGACPGLEDSISQYYGTRVRDLLVGVLFAIGWFLFSYRGYERRDDVAGDLACLFALGVALFPITSPSVLIRAVHLVSATAMFLVLSYFCLCLFTRSDGSPTEEKKRRNKVYVACGVIILVCIALIGVYAALLRDSRLAGIKPVFWLESCVLWAFGFSWLVKGETLWKDASPGRASAAARRGIEAGQAQAR